jgi:UDP-N-acetylmuramate: L-alanyl-gamma-D-glutamyl-meso-diaminopimelate ligase
LIVAPYFRGCCTSFFFKETNVAACLETLSPTRQHSNNRIIVDKFRQDYFFIAAHCCLNFRVTFAIHQRMSFVPSAIYKQCIDKQRIAIFGRGQEKIYQFVISALQKNNKLFDYVADDQSKFSHSPLLIWKAGEANAHSMDFHHHVLVLSGVSPTHMEEIHWMEKLADATPKAGLILFDASDPQAKRIGSKERTDVVSVPFDIFKHDNKNGLTFLISSTNEKFPVSFSSSEDLKAASAALELLKKLGVTSGQFYHSISTVNQ